MRPFLIPSSFFKELIFRYSYGRFVEEALKKIDNAKYFSPQGIPFMSENLPISLKTLNNLFGFKSSYRRFTRATESIKKQNYFRFLTVAKI